MRAQQSTEDQVRELSEAQLTRSFAVQPAGSFVLLIGAGCSISSGVPSAEQMTWILKRELYSSEKGASVESLRDLDETWVRAKLQAFIEEKAWYPGQGSDEEYPVLFEHCYPSQRDRREFVQNYVHRAVPGFGHVCLAALAAHRRVTNIVTTNFDDLVEKALAARQGTSAFVVSPESTARLGDIDLVNPRFLQLFKLHGDFRYDRLQNTAEETQRLNRDIEDALLPFFDQYGLIAIGYSGRDASIMAMLERAVQHGRSFRRGVYWCSRGEESPRLAVEQFLDYLRGQDIPCGVVRITGFEELMYLLYQQVGLRDESVDQIAESRARQSRPFEFRIGSAPGQEVLGTNILRVKQYPSAVIRLPTSIHDWDVLGSLIDGEPAVACLHKDEVLALGNPSRVRSLFASRMRGNATTLRLTDEVLDRISSLVFHLFYGAIGAYLTQHVGLGRLGYSYYVVPAMVEDVYKFTPQSGGSVTVPLARRYRSQSAKGITCFAHPSLSYQLEYRNGELLFVLQPGVVVTSDGHNPLPPEHSRVICNEILSKWYNRQSYEQLAFWLHYLKAGETVVEFHFPPFEQPPPVRFVLEDDYSLSVREDRV